MADPSFLREVPGGVRLTLRVHPRARANRIKATLGDALKVDVTAPPADGVANEAVIALIARALGVPASSVTLVSGTTSRTKVVGIEGIDRAAVVDRLSRSVR